MKAIILAAGRSTRTYPLTLTQPKPLLKVANRTIIEHNLEQLKGLVDEAVIIVNYKKDMITNTLGDEYSGIKLKYIVQEKPLGTADAVRCAKSRVSGKFMVMNGDDLFSRRDIKRCLRHDYAVLGMEVDDSSEYGVLLGEDSLKGIVEKPTEKISNIANVGFYVIDDSIFDLIEKTEKSVRGEFELTDAINTLAQDKVVRIEIVSDYWLPVGYPWDLLKANEFILSKVCLDIKGIVEERATIKGEVVIGKGTIVKNGAYIEGPVMIGENCTIGPNCYIRSATTVGDNCKIGNAVEVKNSILYDNVSVGHLTYLGDSIIGCRTNIGAGNISANLRHDNGNVKSSYGGKLVDSSRRKLGVIIGSGVHTGINSSFYPGRKIWAKMSTLPGETVRKDVMPDE